LVIKLVFGLPDTRSRRLLVLAPIHTKPTRDSEKKPSTAICQLLTRTDIQIKVRSQKCQPFGEFLNRGPRSAKHLLVLDRIAWRRLSAIFILLDSLQEFRYIDGNVSYLASANQIDYMELHHWLAKNSNPRIEAFLNCVLKLREPVAGETYPVLCFPQGQYS